MAVSMTAASETKQAFGYDELFKLGGGSEEPTLDELIVILDGIDDPFVQTVFILHILMPAMVKTKEDNLDDLATSLETMATYTTDLVNIQESFNDLKDPESDFAALAESIVTGIDALLAKIESEDSPLDDSLELQIVTALTGMKGLIQGGGSTYVEQGKTINRLWSSDVHIDTIETIDDNPYTKSYYYHHDISHKEIKDRHINPYFNDMKYKPDENGDPSNIKLPTHKVYGQQYHVYDYIWDWYVMNYGKDEYHNVNSDFNSIMADDTMMKEYLDDFNITGTSLKSQSSLTQALVEHDGSEYNAFIALNKDMFKEFHNQVQAHSRALRNL